MPGDARFRRSSYCYDSSCVEVARLATGEVAVRDSKDLDVRALVYTEQEWAAFVLGVKAGEFDLDVPAAASLS